MFPFEFPHRIQATLLIIAAQLLRQVYHLDPKFDPEQEKFRRSEDLNCTPFVRQYDILNNKWGAVQMSWKAFYNFSTERAFPHDLLQGICQA